mmetsp:Transcript_91998/g.192349  ORF Transcript_91998/g.192349 Transcript_91998/m.192349 type:complete len:592 (+) Transcript_91998:129-1904(+)
MTVAAADSDLRTSLAAVDSGAAATPSCGGDGNVVGSTASPDSSAVSSSSQTSVLRQRSCAEIAWAMMMRKRPMRADGAREALRPTLGALDLTLIGVGSSVGSGIFVIVGSAVKPTGPAVCLSFLGAAISSIFSALCYAELAARIPESGSVYLYAYVAFGEFIALLFGLNVLVDYHFGAAMSVLSCGTYLEKTLLGYFGASSPVPSAKVLAASLTAILTLTLCLGVEEGMKKVNGALVTAKVVIVLIIIVVGSTKMEVENLEPFFPYGVSPVLSTSTMCCFAYIGFGTVANAAEECIRPRRDLPIAIVGSLGICALLYVAFALVLCGLVPFLEMDKDAPVTDAFGPKYANIPWVNALVDWGAIIGLYTTLLSGLYSQARMYLAMSRDGLITRHLGRISTRFGTPVISQVTCGLLAALLAIFLDVESLSMYLTIGVLLSYTIVCAGVLVLRAEKPQTTVVCSTGLTVASVGMAVALSVPWTFDHGGVVQAVVVSVLGIAVLASSGPLLCQKYSTPTSFACPLTPLLPMIGILLNGFLLAQCHWQAWVRLAGTTVLVMLVYFIRVGRTAMRERAVARQLLLAPGSEQLAEVQAH